MCVRTRSFIKLRCVESRFRRKREASPSAPPTAGCSTAFKPDGRQRTQMSFSLSGDHPPDLVLGHNKLSYTLCLYIFTAHYMTSPVRRPLVGARRHELHQASSKEASDAQAAGSGFVLLRTCTSTAASLAVKNSRSEVRHRRRRRLAGAAGRSTLDAVLQRTP